MPYLRVKNELPLIPGYASGDIASFEAAAAPLVSCICTINPVQSGSGDPSPSNIRPITGHDDVTVTQSGRNIFNGIFTEYSVLLEDGTVNTNPNHKTSTDYIYIKGVSSITLSGTNLNLRYSDVATGITRFAFYDVNKNFLSIVEQTGVSPRTTSVPSNACYCLFQCGGKATDVKLEIGSSATTYEPYTGSSHTITFPDTVYGASLDVGSGVLTIDRAIVDLGTIATFSYDSGSKRWQSTITGLYSFPSRNGNLVAEKYVADITASAGDENKMFTAGGAVYIYYTDSTTPPSGNLVYPLATPTTTQLTPEQLNSILGENNFYHDGNGHIDITYIRRYQHAY